MRRTLLQSTASSTFPSVTGIDRSSLHRQTDKRVKPNAPAQSPAHNSGYTPISLNTLMLRPKRERDLTCVAQYASIPNVSFHLDVAGRKPYFPLHLHFPAIVSIPSWCSSSEIGSAGASSSPRILSPVVFQVAQVQPTKFIQAYGLRFATSVTADEVVEEKPATVVHREGATTTKARGCNSISHLTIKGLSAVRRTNGWQ